MPRFPIPENASSHEYAFCRQFTRALQGALPEEFNNRTLAGARFVIGSMLAEAKSEFVAYFTSLSDRLLDSSGNRVSEAILEAFRTAAMRSSVRIAIVLDVPPQDKNPIANMLSMIGSEDKVAVRVLNDFGRQELKGTPHFAIMDRRAYRMEIPPSSTDECAAYIATFDQEHAAIGAEALRSRHLTSKYSDDLF